MSCDVESNPNQTHVITSQQHLTDWLDRLVSEMATGLVVRRGCLLPRPRPALLPARACSAARSASPREDLAVEQLARARAGVGEVELPQPHMENLWTGDTFLQSYLTRVLPPDLRRQLEPDLARSAVCYSSLLYRCTPYRWGARCAQEVALLGRQCEEDPPKLVASSAWGARLDAVLTCPAWRRLKGVAAEEGLISIPYKGEQGEHSRLYQV